MRDESKPFICMKQGWNIKITPRNGEGWRALALWMVGLLLPSFAFIPVAIRFDNTPQENLVLWGIVPVLLLTVLISIVMTRWMLARSEIIDVNGLIEIKRAQDLARKKQGR